MASSPARVLGDQTPSPAPLAVPDSRRRCGRRDELTGVLAIGACACLTGARSYVAIGEWADAQGQAVLDCLDEQPAARALPSEATLRRCLQATDSAALDAAVAGWAVGSWPPSRRWPPARTAIWCRPTAAGG